MNGGRIVNCKTDGNGGAIAIGKGKLVMNGGTIENCSAGSSGNDSAGGAAIYLGFSQSDYATMEISGDPVFRNNTVVKSGYADLKNGGANVYTDNKVRQDIFLTGAGTGSPKTLGTLFVTGKLTDPGDAANTRVMPAGSIWVWVENENHYKYEQQFALVGASYNPSASELEEMLKAFRNSRDDVTAENPVEEFYLYGVPGTGKNIIWGTEPAGMRKVILRKVGSGTYDPIANASFTIYKGSSDEAYIPKGTNRALEGLISGASGCIWIGELPYGWYIVEEDAPRKYFFIVVTESGTYGTLETVGGVSRDKVGGYDSLSDAREAATAQFNELSRPAQPASP